MKKGDIVLSPFPFTDLTGSKNRPCLILIEKAEDVTVAFISTQITFAQKTGILLTPSNENGLKKESLIRLDKIATLSKDLLLGRLGTISNEELLKVDTRLIELFKINVR